MLDKAMLELINEQMLEAETMMQEGGFKNGKVLYHQLLVMTDYYPPIVIRCWLSLAKWSVDRETREKYIAKICGFLINKVIDSSLEIFTECMQEIKEFSREELVGKMLFKELLTLQTHCKIEKEKQEIFTALCNSLQPNHASSEQLKTEIDSFLDTVSGKYIEAIANHDAVKGEVLWGGDIELDCMATLFDVHLVIHLPGDQKIYIGDKSKDWMHLELSNENSGCGHYSLMVVDNYGTFRKISIPGDGNCLFNAFLTGMRHIRGEPATCANSEEIAVLRQVVAGHYDAVQDLIAQGAPRIDGEGHYTVHDNAIRARFETLIYAEEKDFEDILLSLPACGLRTEAMNLRIKLQEAKEQSGNKRTILEVCKPVCLSMPLIMFSLFKPKFNPFKAAAAMVNDEPPCDDKYFYG